MTDQDAFDIDELRRRTERSELGVYGRLPFAPKRARGCRVEDEAGRTWLDLYGGHAVCLTGHSHPRVVEAISAQLDRLVFYSSATYHPIRTEATERLLERAPRPGSRVFHACSGSEANEVAFKMARRETGRRTIVSFEGSFHGRTLATLAAGGMQKYRRTAGPVRAPGHVHLPFGEEDALGAIDGETAAVVCEPIQSLAGARRADDGFYRALEDRCREVGARLIFDEVQTGLGRTGTFFFADSVGVRPDAITLAKGLASGIPASAVVAGPELADAMGPGDQGSTFGGGPVAMAALRATLEVIEAEDLPANAARQGERIRREASALSGIVRVQGQGLLLGLVCEEPAGEVRQALLDRGIITGTSAVEGVLRLLPPLVLGDEEVDEFLEALADVAG